MQPILFAVNLVAWYTWFVDFLHSPLHCIVSLLKRSAKWVFSVFFLSVFCVLLLWRGYFGVRPYAFSKSSVCWPESYCTSAVVLYSSIALLTASLASAWVAHTVQTCHLNFQGIVCWLPAISYWPLATSSAHEIFMLILSSSAFYSVTYGNLSFGSRTFHLLALLIWNSLPLRIC